MKNGTLTTKPPPKSDCEIANAARLPSQIDSACRAALSGLRSIGWQPKGWLFSDPTPAGMSRA